jgi:transposase InsO family protein
LALVALSVVEQRLDAVRAVLAGATVVEVAAGVGVSRQSVHTWVARYLLDGVAGLADRSRRPHSSPAQASADVEVVVCELRRQHPRWGAKRIRLQLLKAPAERSGTPVPSERTINRMLTRHGLLTLRPRRKPKSAYKRWQREAPMQLWQLDIVGGVFIVDTATGELREVKVVTAVDDHSRYCVIAKVVPRATSRAVCLAFAAALQTFGVPEEVITDNGKQFTDRFSRYRPERGETLFDKICRRNGITHRLTEPATPTQNGKVERFHGTLRREFLDDTGPFVSVEAAQVGLEAWVAGYNADRPHQALDPKQPVTPHDRFAPVPADERAVLGLWLPPTLAVTAPPAPAVAPAAATTPTVLWAGSAVEFDRIVPPSGNLWVAGQQFWLGPHRAGQVIRFWADCDRVHLLVAGSRIKTLRSRFSDTDLTRLRVGGAQPAGPPPQPHAEPGDDGAAVEVDRVVSRVGTVVLAHRHVMAAEILAGRPVGVRIDGDTIAIFDPQTRELLRTRPNPLTAEQLRRVRGARRAGPPPRPSLEPVRVQRRASNSGVIMVVGQRVSLGRLHAGRTVAVAVSDTTLAIELDDGETRVVRRTTDQAVRNIKGHRPRTGTQAV